MNLAGQVALVTGAGRGIGRGCALALSEAGADVILNDRPGSPDVEDTRARISEGGRTCHVVLEDVFERAGCQRLVNQAIESGGRIDILVSNPAYSRRGEFLHYPPEEFEAVLRGTLVSGFHLSQLVARHLVQRGEGGKIVFISSVQGEMPLSHSVAYNAAKAGLNHLAMTISVELAPHKINVNVIEPGWIDTPGERETFGAELIAEEGRKLPWQRLGTPADIGRAVRFLVSDEADYITGSILCVDGGFRFKDCRGEGQILPRHQGQ